MLKGNYRQEPDFQPTFMTLPKRIWELEAWSPPGLQLDQDYGKVVLAPEMWSAGIRPDVFLGLSAIPDPIDCQNLKADVQAGTATEEAFVEFCSSHGLRCSMDDKLSASRFLEFTNGCLLAWVHIPDDNDARSIAFAIQNLLAAKGLRLLDAFTGEPMTALE
jgi:hypothetical protein